MGFLSGKDALRLMTNRRKDSGDPAGHSNDAREFDGFREECGVFAIHGHPEAANLAYLGLYALQHRGQESAGICSSELGRQADRQGRRESW